MRLQEAWSRNRVRIRPEHLWEWVTPLQPCRRSSLLPPNSPCPQRRNWRSASMWYWWVTAHDTRRRTNGFMLWTYISNVRWGFAEEACEGWYDYAINCTEIKKNIQIYRSQIKSTSGPLWMVFVARKQFEPSTGCIWCHLLPVYLSRHLNLGRHLTCEYREVTFKNMCFECALKKSPCSFTGTRIISNGCIAIKKNNVVEDFPRFINILLPFTVRFENVYWGTCWLEGTRAAPRGSWATRWHERDHKTGKRLFHHSFNSLIHRKTSTPLMNLSVRNTIKNMTMKHS